MAGVLASILAMLFIFMGMVFVIAGGTENLFLGGVMLIVGFVLLAFVYMLSKSEDRKPTVIQQNIDVKFDSKNKPNRQIKTITITANTDPAITRLKIMGFVTTKSKLAGPVKK